MKIVGNKKDDLARIEIQLPGKTFPHLCVMKSYLPSSSI